MANAVSTALGSGSASAERQYVCVSAANALVTAQALMRFFRRSSDWSPSKKYIVSAGVCSSACRAAFSQQLVPVVLTRPFMCDCVAEPPVNRS